MRWRRRGKTEEKASSPQETSAEQTKDSQENKASQEKTAREETTREKASREETEREKAERGPARERSAEETSPAASNSASEEEGDYEAVVTVTRVVDGDTVDISPAIDSIDRVRFIGVDTPETRECPGGQPLSQEAKAYTTSELQGQEVGLEFDVERTDRFDRLLAYVYEDEEMFNEDLLEEGYAQVATFPPNVRYVDRFLVAQERTRTAGLGIWALPPDQLAQLEDRGNGIGGAGCASSAPPPKTQAPTPPQPQEEPSTPTPVPTPTPDVPPTPAAPRPQPVPQPVPAAPRGGDVDCSDFGSSAEAQAFLLPGDPNRLDADGDGQACDSLG